MFLQATGPRTWYALWHKSSDFENNIDGAVATVTSPEGKKSLYKCDVFIISTVCSLQFAAVNRDNATDVVSVNRVVWVINVVALYRGITVIYFNKFPSLRRSMYLSLQSLERQKSQTIRPPIDRIYHRNMDKIMGLKLYYEMSPLFINHTIQNQTAIIIRSAYSFINFP